MNVPFPPETGIKVRYMISVHLSEEGYRCLVNLFYLQLLQGLEKVGLE